MHHFSAAPKKNLRPLLALQHRIHSPYKCQGTSLVVPQKQRRRHSFHSAAASRAARTSLAEPVTSDRCGRALPASRMDTALAPSLKRSEIKGPWPQRHNLAESQLQRSIAISYVATIINNGEATLLHSDDLNCSVSCSNSCTVAIHRVNALTITLEAMEPPHGDSSNDRYCPHKRPV